MIYYTIEQEGNNIVLACLENTPESNNKARPVPENTSQANSLTLVRAFGDQPNLLIPEILPDGKSITSIAPYCFSQTQKWIEPWGQTPPPGSQWGQTPPQDFPWGQTPLAGNNIEVLGLPETVTEMGEYALYNCRKLERLKVSANLNIIHGDAFMNCTKLHTLIVTGDPAGESGLSNILSRIKTSLDICFQDEAAAITGRIFYPEYSMNYESVYAAHIFQMRVNGSGYAPRQAFKGRTIDYAAYDEAVQNAFPLEELRCLIKLCSCRLAYPTGLSPKFKQFYSDYIRQNDKEACMYLIDGEETKLLKSLLKDGLISQKALKCGIDYARAKGNLRFLMGIMGR